MDLLCLQRRPLRWSVILIALAGTGCASLPPGQGRDEVVQLVSARGRSLEQRSEAEAKKWVAERLSQPLDVDATVQIALAQNPRLRAEYARLGIAGAEVYDAGRLANPRLSAAYLSSNEPGAADQVTFGLAQSFTSLLLLPARSRFAQAEFLRVQQSVGAEILNLAAETEVAFYELAGARQLEKMRAAIARAATASAELAQRFFDAGNITRLELNLEQAAAARAQLDLLEAQQRVAAARAELNGLMGLKGAERDWSIASGLPAPLRNEDSFADLLRLTSESRLDLLAARGEVKLLADSLGVTRRFRYLGEVEVGVETGRETDRSRLTGPNLSLQLPIFNQGSGAVAKAQAQLQDAEARLQELEVAATNALQLASLRVANAKTRAEAYRDALIPLREQIVARTQEQVNYMLVGQFELLRAKQEEYEAYRGYLEAVTDYWVARTELAREVGARLPSSAQAAEPVLDAEELTRPKGGGMQMNHEGMPMDDMKGMDHDMEGMDHSGHGAQPAAAPKEDPHAGHRMAPQQPPPAKKPLPAPAGRHKGHSDMPTGMESQAPAPGGANSKPAQEKSDETHTHQHGEQP